MGATPQFRGNVSLPTSTGYALSVPGNYVVVFSGENFLDEKFDEEM
ncbi:hypothetical protein [Massilia sp. Mn16-1_5]|nr:hypothetical protein [Massilia sp. Mn16-1_5]